GRAGRTRVAVRTAQHLDSPAAPWRARRLAVAAWSLNSPQRLAALAEVDVFPGAPDDAFAVYTRLVARVLDVPTALVSFLDGDCQFFPAATGLDEQTA